MASLLVNNLVDIAVSKRDFDKGLSILTKRIKNSNSIKDIRHNCVKQAIILISTKFEAEKIIDKLLDEDLAFGTTSCSRN